MEPSESITRQRLASALIVLFAVCGVAISVFLFVLLRDNHMERVKDEFLRSASDRAGAIEAAFRRSIGPLVAVGAYVATTDSLSRESFARFAQPLLARNPGVKALSYITRVPAARRADFETHARQEFPGFSITDRDADQRMIPAAQRAEYYPVYYIEPVRGNERAVGFDLSSQAARRTALAESRDTGVVVATARIRLVQEQADQFSFLLINPLYRQGAQLDTLTQRRNNLRGYTTEVIRVGDLVEHALAILNPGGIDIAVVDASGLPDERLLYFHSSRRRQPPGSYVDLFGRHDASLNHTWEFELANRRWSIESRAVPGVFSLTTPTHAWGTLLAGLAFTLLLLGYLGIMRRHATRLSAERDNLERRVRERTAALETAHQNLLRQERLATLGQLTGSVAHELRNPLSTVLNSIEVIDKNSASDVIERNLERARRNIHRCDRIITELLDFGRTRGPLLKATPVDPWLREQLENFELPDTITLDRQLQAGDTAVAMDSDLLGQALTNVLINACQALEGDNSKSHNRRIIVRSRRFDQELHIEIEDNGPGIPESELAHVREPLYSTKTFGVGLGLPIVQRVMQQHNGGFEIFSSVGRGTRAVLSLKTVAARASADGE